MFFKFKNLDNQSPYSPESPPNPLYAMLAADTAAMEAGKKQAKSALLGKNILILIP
jgi:hypothetical protein